MQHIRVATFVCVIANFTSCVYWPTVEGPYRWTYNDTVEVDRLIRQRRDIPTPIETVQVITPDRAVIYCGRMDILAGDPSWQIVFTVHRENGRWVIDEGSIHKQEFIITA